MIKPLANHILLEIIKEEKTTSGIIFAENAQKKSQMGLVVATGPGNICSKTDKLVPCAVKPQQKVIFSQYSGTEIEHQGKKYLLVKDEDLLAVVE